MLTREIAAIRLQTPEIGDEYYELYCVQNNSVLARQRVDARGERVALAELLGTMNDSAGPDFKSWLTSYLVAPPEAE